MTDRYKNTDLWRNAFESGPQAPFSRARQRLGVAFESFRAKADLLAREIPKDVQQLTDHSIDHMDDLWEMADIILDGRVELNAAEAFIFGGAVLLHDLANTVAAFPRGLEDLYGKEWDDLVHAAYSKKFDRRPTAEECRRPHESVYPDILLTRLRQTHARQAEALAIQGFYRQDGTEGRVHLLDDEALRQDLGVLIGRIAHSHHWSIQEVVQKFKRNPGTSPVLPREWSIDALKVAFLLRAADAAHLDRRRTPGVTHAVRRFSAASKNHWTFQDLLLRPELHHEQLQFTSRRPFTYEEREAWWLCHDTLRMVDQELRGIDEILRIERPYRFPARSVAGVGSPEGLAGFIHAKDWEPVEVRVRISDVVGVVERFGGANLYGDDPLFPLRELIANAADAIRARRALRTQRDSGRITIRLGQDNQQWWLEVEDEGIGMSESVLRGPLLDFGMSYWNSELAMKERPGLRSSDFEPTGKFGIGFFSVFMLGDKVRVTTRVFDDPRSSGRVLEVSHGDGSHPFIRRLEPGHHPEIVPDGGTCVRIWLKTPIQEGLLKGFLRVSQTTPDGLMDALSQAVSYVAPTLDVSIDCAVLLDSPKKRSTVDANDWETLPFDALLKRLTAPEIMREPSFPIGSPQEIRREGRLIARIQLDANERGFQGLGHISVRGLSTLNPVGHFHGIMLGDKPNLSRTDASPLPSKDEIRSFIGTYPLHEKDWIKMNWEQRLCMAHLFLTYELKPAQVPCFILDSKYRTLDEVERWLEEVQPGHSIRLVYDGDFELHDTKFTSPEDKVPLGDFLNRWRQPVDLVAAGQPLYSFNTGLLQKHSPHAAGQTVELGPNDRIFVTPLAALVLESAARVWNADATRLARRGRAAQRLIGKMRGFPMYADLIILTRPGQAKRKARRTKQ